jgi:hypothetical protein
VESKEAEAAAEKMNAKFENGKILYNEIELSVKVLEGEEEQKYWSEFGKQKMESSSKRGVKSKFNQREHAVRRRSKRHAEKDELCEVKAKRYV